MTSRARMQKICVDCGCTFKVCPQAYIRSVRCKPCQAAVNQHNKMLLNREKRKTHVAIVNGDMTVYAPVHHAPPAVDPLTTGFAICQEPWLPVRWHNPWKITPASMRQKV